jgi:hypothetical protein
VPAAAVVFDGAAAVGPGDAVHASGGGCRCVARHLLCGVVAGHRFQTILCADRYGQNEDRDERRG